MGSGAVMYVPGFIKIGSCVEQLMRGGYTQTHGQQRDLINLLYLFEIRKLRQKSNEKFKKR
jgi:hypothetical protein